VVFSFFLFLARVPLSLNLAHSFSTVEINRQVPPLSFLYSPRWGFSPRRHIHWKLPLGSFFSSKSSTSAPMRRAIIRGRAALFFCSSPRSERVRSWSYAVMGDFPFSILRSHLVLPPHTKVTPPPISLALHHSPPPISFV